MKRQKLITLPIPPPFIILSMMHYTSPKIHLKAPIMGLEPVTFQVATHTRDIVFMAMSILDVTTVMYHVITMYT